MKVRMSLEILMACESAVADIAFERLFSARSRRHGRSGSRSCELNTMLESAWRSKTYRATVSRPSGTERWYHGYQDPALQRRALDRVRDTLSFTQPIGVLQEDGSFDKVPRTPPLPSVFSTHSPLIPLRITNIPNSYCGHHHRTCTSQPSWAICVIPEWT
jgi:hypothetical protein